MAIVHTGTNNLFQDYDNPAYQDVNQNTPYSISVPDLPTVTKSPKIVTTRSSSGFRPYTNYSVSGSTAKESIGRYRVGVRSNTYKRWDYYTGDCFLYTFSFGALPTYNQTLTERNALLTSAYADAKEQALDVTTNLGELPEAFRMLAQAKKRLLSSVEETVQAYIRKHRRKGKLWIAANIWADIGSFWLEYRYGWKPLIGTLQDLGKSVAKVRMGESVICVGAKTNRITTAHPSFTYSHTQTYGPTATRLPTIAVTRESTVTSRASVAMQMSPVDAAFNGTVLSAAWELLTLSFIVDWFINVGDFLSALAVDTQVPSEITMCTSLDIRTKAILTGTWPQGSTIAPWECVCEKFSYSRTVQSGFTPTLTFNPSGLNLVRGLDVTALIAQVVRKYI